MVAYSFKRQFVADIEAGRKRQTIRAPRRRHARPGEPLQLYTGMRSRACRLIRDDVVCTAVGEVVFDLRCLAGIEEPRDARAFGMIVAQRRPPLVVNGIPLESLDAQDKFAAADGFGGWGLHGHDPLGPFEAMVLFWLATHGPRLFEGVLIHWEPRA